MDIVDTFNHLIPTEHLDDALFLGSNLENEVCEDFSTSQNVLEDSLKNMLSDKDPMLGSASAQFCLPVLDSTDPNFQMPCSTAVGLDDIMDVRVKETAHSTVDEGDLSSNRKLRDQMDGISTKSPRKSPRLMNQEPVRSLRQSTLAKRSNSSSVPTKKTIKFGPAQKGGLKQHDKGQAKQDDSNSNAPEQFKKNEPSNNSSQLEETEEIPPSSSGNSEWVPSCAESESTGADNEHEIPTEPKVKLCHETGNSSNLPDSITLCKEMENGAQTVTENYSATIGTESASSTFVEADKVTYSNSLKHEGDEVMKYSSEISSSEKASHKTEEEQNRTEIDQNKETGTSDILLISKTCENSSEIQEDLTVQSNFVDKKAECNLDLKASDDIAHNVNFQQEDKQERSDNLVKADLKDNLPLNNMEFEQTDLKDVGTNSIKLEASTLEDNIIQDIPTQTVYQERENVKMGELEISGLQEDGHSDVPLKYPKKTKSKNTKTKQSKTITTQQKLATVGQDTHSKIHVLPSPRSQSSVSLKRHIQEQGNIQHCQKIIKVKKQHSDKDIRFQSCDSGISLKKQIHEVGKNIPRGQIPVQVRKITTERMNDRSVSHHVGSKEGLHLVLGTAHSKQGQLPQQSQKQPQKYQLKANNCIKEEGGKKDSIALLVDYLKDDEKEKMKVRKLEKNLQPRQRRSSKSLSVDEPPLFIPDNISTVKRESTELLSPSESKSVWIPSKQCGFCRKPHGNSCVSTPALQHG